MRLEFHPAIYLDDEAAMHEALAKDARFQQLLAQQRAEIAYVAANFDYSAFDGFSGGLIGCPPLVFPKVRALVACMLQVINEGNFERYAVDGPLMTGGTGPEFEA